MHIKYQFFGKDSLFIQKFSGDFSIGQYMQFAQSIIHHPKSKFVNNVIIDFRDIEFEDEPDATLGDLDKVIKLRKGINSNAPKIRDIYHVFWVDKPLPTVMAQLFKSNFPKMNYQYCSTAQEVINLLKLPDHLKDLENVVSQLEHTG